MLRGFEADVRNLVACFVSQHGRSGSSFEGFKHVWCAAARPPSPAKALRRACIL
jgi:hypothetical protein